MGLDRVVKSRIFQFLAIVVLPAMGFAFDLSLGEPLTVNFGPALYTIYAVGLAAYVALSFARLPASAASVAAGVLVAGTVVSLPFAALGLLGASSVVAAIPHALLHSGSLSLRGPSNGAIISNALTLAISLAPVATVLALGLTAFYAGRRSWKPLGSRSLAVGIVAGAALATGAMFAVQTADAAWIATRLAVFEGDDRQRWDEALQDVSANPLCGRQRCMRRVCGALGNRFGRAPNGVPMLAAEDAARFSRVSGQDIDGICQAAD